jgi:hypothetical protein
MHTKVWSENLEGRGRLEGLGIDDRIISVWILDQDRGQWCALVNSVMDLRVP